MNIPMGATMEMRFPLLQDFLPTILSCCREISGLFGFSHKDTLRLEIALEEALTAIIPGESSDPLPKSLTVRFRRVPLGIRVILGEFHAPLDRKSMDAYSPGEEPDERDFSGLGLFLMRNLVDQAAFYDFEAEGRGKELHLFKMLRREADEPLPLLPLAAIPEKTEPAVREKPFSSERVAPSRVSAITASFAHPGGESVESLSSIQLREALADPDISLFAAWGERGELLALQALTASAQRRSLGVAFPPLFSKNAEKEACAATLLNALIEHVEDDGEIEGLLGFVPGKSPAMASLFASKGFAECALLPALPGNSFLKGNVAGMASFRPCALEQIQSRPGAPEDYRDVLRRIDAEEAQRAPLYAPERLHALLRLLLKEGKQPLLSHPLDNQEGFRKRSVISAAAEFQKQRCDLIVHDYGLDFLFQLSGLTSKLLGKDLASLTLHLPMELAATASGAEEAEKAGYVFCGVIPGTPQGSELIYVHCKNLPELLEAAHPATDTGRQLVAWAGEDCRRIRFLTNWD